MPTLHRVLRDIATSILMLQCAFTPANAFDVPHCLAHCLNSSVHPCDSHSLPSFLTCVNDRCTHPPAQYSNLSLSLSPKTEFSCQNSLVPGAVYNDASQVLLVRGNQTCVNSAVYFRSFVTPGLNEREYREGCRLSVFPERECHGEMRVLTSLALRASGCIFEGGKSVRLTCGEEGEIESHASRYAAFAASLCADSNATLLLRNTTRNSSSMPLGRSPPRYTTQSVNATTTLSGSMLSRSTSSPSGAPFIAALPGVASMEKHVQRSVVALVGVVVFAVVLL